MGDRRDLANPWLEVQYEIRRFGCPRKAVLVKALRSGYPVPDDPDIRRRIADAVEGTGKFRRGNRPEPKTVRELRRLHKSALTERVRRLTRFYKRRGKSGAFCRALEAVSEKYGVSESALDTYCYPRIKK